MFDDIIDRIYEPSVDAWLPNIPDSDERVALVSLAYNGVVGFKADGSFKSPLLRQAIIDDQRAEAWYEIRYQSDADGQHTGRRIDESNLFGLYDHPELGVQEAEAKEVLQMYTAHREQIRTYESQHAQDYPTGGTTSIDFQLIGAKTPLIQAYAQFAGAPSIDGEVLVGSDLQRDTFDLQPVSIPGVPAHIFDLSKSDLLLGEGGDDFLRGRGGDDVLYGGAGDDRLVGDAGNDYLFGGAGFDTYVYATGDGHDRIEDSDANGVIFVNGQMLVGGVKKDGHTDWVSPDGHIQYVMQGTDLVVKLNGTQILTVNENFQSGQFGIRLVERAEERMTA